MLEETKLPEAEIVFESGVSLKGKPFTHILWGDQRGQLSPAQMRALGIACFRAAEDAEQDAAVYAWMMQMTADKETSDERLRMVSAVLAELRRVRGAARDADGA